MNYFLIVQPFDHIVCVCVHIVFYLLKINVS